MSIRRLGYMGFEVSDVRAWRSFATAKLGTMEASANETEATFRIDSRAWRLSVSCYGSGYLSLGGGCLSRVRPGRFPELQREHRAMRRT
nr:hypothetical protein [Pandoraea pnomenusa]